MKVLFFAALQGYICASTSHGLCTAPLGECDLQGHLSLIQKGAAQQLVHTRKQAAARQPEDEADTKEDGSRSVGAGEPPKDEPVVKEKTSSRHPLQGKCPAMQAVTILGCMTFIMSMIYLVNSSSVLMRVTAYQMVSETTSILAAVLIYDSVHKIIKAALGTNEASVEDMSTEEEVPLSDMGDFTFYAVKGLVWWLFFTAVLFHRKAQLLHLKAYGTIGGHILGFAAINAWGSLATTRTFESSPSMTFLVVIIYSVVFLSMLSITSKLMAKIVSGAQESNQRVLAQWHEQCYETAKDSYCLGMSFLLCMWIRFVITGSPTPLREQVRPHPTFERVALAAVGLCLLVFAALIKKVEKLAEARGFDQDEDFLHLFLADATMISAMTAGWVFLFAIHWKIFDGFGNSFFANTAVALLVSALACVFIFVCYILRQTFDTSRRTLRGALVGVALGVGFSWEMVFDASVEHVAEVQDATLTTVIIYQFMLVLFLIPVWMLHIYPHDNHELLEAMSERLKNGPLPISALWSDDGLYDAVDSK